MILRRTRYGHVYVNWTPDTPSLFSLILMVNYLSSVPLQAIGFSSSAILEARREVSWILDRMEEV